MLKTICWGTRGSIPVSGPSYSQHGGSTTCLEIQLIGATGPTPSRVIIDCGTGLASLARAAGASCRRALFLQTHCHWDHIQGFPFFSPLFNPLAHFDFWSVRREGKSLKEVIEAQMSKPFFPVALDDLPAKLNFEEIPAVGTRQLGDLKISWMEVCHPSGASAYRIDYRDRSVVFSGDVEVRKGSRAALVELAGGADLFIMDAQYLPEEYANREGFGHSTPVDAVEVATEAGARRLLMTHHDPSHGDERLAQKLTIARRRAFGLNSPLQVDNARDGMEVYLTPPATAHREWSRRRPIKSSDQ